MSMLAYFLPEALTKMEQTALDAGCMEDVWNSLQNGGFKIHTKCSWHERSLDVCSRLDQEVKQAHINFFSLVG